MKIKDLYLFLFAFGFALSSVAQDLPEFMMMDTTVTDCDGYLSDSGGPGESYSINEDLTFTVNSGAQTIEVTFLDEICIEDGFDYLYIYDGPDIGSPLLAEVTGAGFIPPGVTATSGAITFQFITDQSASYCGFNLFFNSIAGPPTPPIIVVNEIPECESTSVLVDFSMPIGCSWLEPDSVSFFGNEEIDVISTLVTCTNGQGDLATFELAEPLQYNCDYTIQMIIGIPDACDSLWYFPLTATFQMISCPIQSTISADEEALCAGNCTNVQAAVQGCFDHAFSWDNGLPAGPGPHLVCPVVTTTYSVTITEIPTGNSTTESITIEVINADILIPSGDLCQSEPAFVVDAMPSGGLWYGPGVQNEETGYFIPDSADTGINVIYYVYEELCYDSVIFDITAIDAGLYEAACPGAAPFFLEPITPGGTWEGDFVDLDGLFNPSTEGSYPLVYFFNGCTDTLIANVADITGQFALDTLCQSNWPDTILFSPLGGTWTGAGIIDDFYGVFDPSSIDPGDYILLYEVQGCDQEFTIHIKETYTGNRVRTSCPEEEAYIPQPDFAPAGGYWEGVGITDSVTGMYDPGIVPNDYWTQLIYYAPNGCIDTIFYYNVQTDILLDIAYLCIDDDGGPLEWETVGSTPWNGDWTGAGITNPWNNYFVFTPSSAGVGEHWLLYDANDCSDSLLVYVYPTELNATSYSMCSNEPAFLLDESIPGGGTWSGSGISNENTGLFDPNIADDGSYYVYWNTPSGCHDSIFVEVETFFQASIDGLDEIYCFEDIDIELMLSPDDGILTGSTDPFLFNPAIEGPGEHQVILTWTGLNCMSADTVNVFVYPELIASLETTDELICPGAGTLLFVTAEGGFPDALYSYSWSDGLFPLSENTAIPETSQFYYVSIDDGCSDTFTDSIFIEVLPLIETLITTSDTLCFGEEGSFAAVLVETEGNFSIGWSGNGVVEDNLIATTAGSIVNLLITDMDNGCEFDSLILVPSYTAISALFSPNPNSECIAWDSQPITFIDYSQNALSGSWDFGNESTQAYEQGSNPNQIYDQPGNYTVLLEVMNEGGCPDSVSVGICILPPTPIFIPDIFSPNGDLTNDVLYVRGQGIVALNFSVYDRWGKMVFNTTTIETGWDGNAHGQRMPSGVYVYYLQVRLNTGEVEELNGNVTLIR
jgi:gliding motility-associated-like protein